MDKLNAVVSKLEEIGLRYESILGIVCTMGLKVSTISLDEQKDIGLENSSTFPDLIEKRIFEFISKEDYQGIVAEFHSKDKKYKQFPLIKINTLFNTLSYYLNFYFPKDRKNSDGDELMPLTDFKQKKGFNLYKKRDTGKFLLSDYQEIYELFFFHLGFILNEKHEDKPSIENYKESFVFSNIIAQYFNYNDPHGLTFFIEQLRLPPLFHMIISPYGNELIFRKEGENYVNYLPIHIALQGFLSGLPGDMSTIIWNESRYIYYDQKTLKPRNTEYQYKNPKFIIEVYNKYIHERLKSSDMVNYLIDNRELFNNEHNKISSFKFKKSKISLKDNIFKLIKKRWGFDLDNIDTNPKAITYLAIFHFVFIYAWIGLLEDDFPALDKSSLN